MADEEAPVEKSWEIVKVIDTATPGVYLAKLKKYSVLTEAPESDDNTLLVYPTVALRDVSTDATRRISLPHLTTKLWVVDAPERPADSVCKGIIRANGLRKVSSLTLGQHTAELVNARKLLDLPVERENRPARVESDVEESEEEAERLTEIALAEQANNDHKHTSLAGSTMDTRRTKQRARRPEVCAIVMLLPLLKVDMIELDSKMGYLLYSYESYSAVQQVQKYIDGMQGSLSSSEIARSMHSTWLMLHP